MNDAAKQDDGLNEGRPAELPALLVAGGSCSRLCRTPRVTESGPRFATPQHEEAARQLHSAD
jgi:hypothetical protein